jgi:hypothetical protein
MSFEFNGSIETPRVIDISYDQLGDGHSEIIHPGEDLTVSDINDDVAPTTSIQIDGNHVNNWYGSGVNINLSAKDNQSGVSQTFYRLNDTEEQKYTGTITLKDEGQHELKYYSLDKSGNYELPKLEKINIDKTKPELFFELSTETNLSGWFNKNVLIHSIAEDNLSGILKVTTDQMVQDEGANQKFTGEAVDMSGNKTIRTITLNVDKTPPQTDSSINGLKALNEDWFVGDVTFTMTGQDQLSGVSYSEYSVDNGLTWTQYEQPVVLTADGVHTILYRSIDLAGNTESMHQQIIPIDQSAPQTELSLKGTKGDNNWYVDDVTITLVANDQTTKVNYIEYSLDQGQTWHKYLEPFTMTEDLIYKVQYRSTDILGNIEDLHEQLIKLDKTDPLIEDTVNPIPNHLKWNNSDVELIFKASDNLSGVKFTTADMLISTEGADQYYIGVAVDQAGNKASTTVYLNIDKTSPVTEITLDGEQGLNDWYVGDVTLNLTAKDSLSGFSNTEYSFDNGNTWEKYTQPIQLTEDNKYKVWYRSVDIAGNYEDTKEIIILLDKTKPRSNLTVKGTKGTNGWYKGNVVLALSAKDLLSGIAGIQYSLDQGVSWMKYESPIELTEDQEYSVYYRSIDVAGNIEDYNIASIKLDKTKPLLRYYEGLRSVLPVNTGN